VCLQHNPGCRPNSIDDAIHVLLVVRLLGGVAFAVDIDVDVVPEIAVVPDEGTQIRLPPGWRVVQQHDREISRALKVNAVPYAYVLDGQRKVVAAGIPNAVKDLALMWTQLSQAAQTPAQAVVGAARG
jgi:hypothetical protein